MTTAERIMKLETNVDNLNVKVDIGFPVQVVNANFSAVATGTTIIPNDDTIPQNTEGTEFMTLSITPKSATNMLCITAKMFLSYSTADNLIGALFRDSTAGAVAAQAVYQSTATGAVTVIVTHTVAAGSTSPTTFKVRAGGGTAGTITFNGQIGARRFGGITLSSLQIVEYKA